MTSQEKAGRWVHCEGDLSDLFEEFHILSEENTLEEDSTPEDRKAEDAVWIKEFIEVAVDHCHDQIQNTDPNAKRLVPGSGKDQKWLYPGPAYFEHLHEIVVDGISKALPQLQ